MARPTLIHGGEEFSSAPLAIGLFFAATFLVGLCARHAKVHRNYKSQTNDSEIAPRSEKASPLLSHRKSDKESEEAESSNSEEGYGEVGLWQKAILMGEKCQPPEFSGVLFYDSYGKRISELPKSPRAIPAMRNFASFPAAQEAH